MLHWFAAARAEHIPPAPRPGARAGRPRLRRRPDRPARRPAGYRHVGVDLVAGLAAARRASTASCRSAATCSRCRSPTACADVVVGRGDPRARRRRRRPRWPSALPGAAAGRHAGARHDRRHPAGPLIAVGHRRADPGRRPAGHPRPGAVRRPAPAGGRGRPARRRPALVGLRPSVRDCARLAPRPPARGAAEPGSTAVLFAGPRPQDDDRCRTAGGRPGRARYRRGTMTPTPRRRSPWHRPRW